MSLRERKQLRARERIVEAAYELFDERGFAQVTVADIADRAEVGRTTFFRHFGDKQEVIFADERRLVEAIAAAPAGWPAPATLREALVQLAELVPAVGGLIVGDPGRYARHQRLLADNPELQDRANRKLQRIATAMENLLGARGADRELAVEAAQLAVACFRAAQRVAGADPVALLPAMNRAVDRLLGL